MKKTIATLILLMGLASGVSADDTCLWDVTSAQWDQPDGVVTFDRDIPWYTDDVWACYYIMTTYPQYLVYQPKCDINGDGSVSMDEVYDIYYHQGDCPEGAYRPDAVCVEAYHHDGNDAVVCSGPDYRRLAKDIEMIRAAHPVTELVFTGNVGSVFNPGLDEILCGASGVDFPIDWFDELNAQYGAESRCLFQTGDMCGSLWPQFAQAVNVWEVLPGYLARALEYSPAAYCELSSWVGLPPGPKPGFHAHLNPDYAEYGVYDWTILVQDDCDYYGCECDLTITLSTYNNHIYFYEQSGSCY